MNARSPGIRLKGALANLVLVLASLAVAGLLLEFVVFRLVLVAADLPRAAFVHGVIRHQPGQTGIFRIRDEVCARWRINAQGWNSGHDQYGAKPDGVFRVAVVGDSYVEGLHVDVEAGLAEDLEGLLGPGYEVYRFGISGAPASQYLHMLRTVVADADPDLVVVNLVHNDLDESWRFQPGVYTSAFLKLEVRDGAVVREIPPRPWRPPWYEFLRRSATWRYLGVRQQVSFSILRNRLLGRDQAVRYEANVEVAAPRPDNTKPDPAMANDRAALDYLFAKMAGLARERGFALLLLMDGVRAPVEAGHAGPWDYASGALALNRLVLDAAGRAGLACLDLHPVFAADFAANGHAFSFPHDAHWNAYAHQLVARTVLRWMTGQGLAPATRQDGSP